MTKKEKATGRMRENVKGRQAVWKSLERYKVGEDTRVEIGGLKGLWRIGRTMKPLPDSLTSSVTWSFWGRAT